MDDINNTTNTESHQQELVVGINSPPIQSNESTWQQNNLDIVFPLLIIGAGLLQLEKPGQRAIVSNISEE